MPAQNLMSALEAALADQVEDDERAPFRSVDCVREFISDENPPTTTNITLEMCVVAVKESASNFHLQLIDADYADQIDKVVGMLDKLDQQRRNQFVFALTLWKPKKRSITETWQYDVGVAYVFEKVHGLRLYYALPQGSVQLQIHRASDTLPVSEGGHDLGELRAAVAESTSNVVDDEDRATPATLKGKTTKGGTGSAAGDADTDANPSPKKRGRAAKTVGK